MSLHKYYTVEGCLKPQRRSDLKLEDIVPWGRSKAEYVAMFGLTNDDLSGRVLDCAGGPSSFNAEATREGLSVVSCDPIYRFSAEDISKCVEETQADVMRNVRENAGAFVWTYTGSPEQHAETRMATMHRFLEDFPDGFEEGRYVGGGLPELPFEADSFDLALCSHFLFTYSLQLSQEFHLASILDMCRVAKEVRIFPLLTSSVHHGGNAGQRSPHLDPVYGRTAGPRVRSKCSVCTLRVSEGRQRNVARSQTNEPGGEGLNADKMRMHRERYNKRLSEADAFFQEFGALDDRAYEDGAIGKKYKELMGLAISVTTRCNECIVYHLDGCIKEKSSRVEIVEAIKSG